MPRRRNLSMISRPTSTGQSLCSVHTPWILSLDLEPGLDSVRVVGGSGANIADVKGRGVALQGS